MADCCDFENASDTGLMHPSDLITASGQGESIVETEDVVEDEAEDAMVRSSDDEEDLGSIQSKATAASGQVYEIEMPSKAPQCFLCKRLASSPSPLAGANRSDKWGGFVPWNSYTKVTKNGGKIVKRPKGKLCLISRNVFNKIGYTAKYGIKNKFAAYKKVMADKDGAEVHRNFLSSEKAWIELHKEGVVQIRSGSRIDDVKRRLEVEDQRSSDFKGRKKVFIEVQHWDEKKDGILDQSKIEEQTVFGAKKKGVWK